MYTSFLVCHLSAIDTVCVGHVEADALERSRHPQSALQPHHRLAADSLVSFSKERRLCWPSLLAQGHDRVSGQHILLSRHQCRHILYLSRAIVTLSIDYRESRCSRTHDNAMDFRIQLGSQAALPLLQYPRSAVSGKVLQDICVHFMSSMSTETLIAGSTLDKKPQT